MRQPLVFHHQMQTKTMIKSLLRRAISIIIESIIRRSITKNTQEVEIGAENTEAEVMKIATEDTTHPFSLRPQQHLPIAVQDLGIALDKLLREDIEMNLEEKVDSRRPHLPHLLDRKSLNSVAIHLNHN